MSSLKREFIKTSIIGFLIAGFVIGFLYYFITQIVIEEKIQKARLQAQTMIYYRHYLSLIAPKVKILDKNLSPFAITPAYVTNQVAKMLRLKGIYVKQTSDRYRNPLDKPNLEELNAIEFFKTHKNEYEFYVIHNPDEFFKEKHIFYARKLVVEKSCLKCHGVPFKDVPPDLYKKIVKIYGDRAFNYHLGEIRGIISIVFPYDKVLKKVEKIFFFIAGIGIIFFILGLFIFYKLNERINKDISKILSHFKFTESGKYPIFKDKMRFVEFEKIKEQINKTFFTLKKYEGMAYHKYYFNSLTNIPNRNKFLEVIKGKNRYIIVLLNIDKFKEINFYFGVEIANELILDVSKRLKNLKKKYKFKLFHIDIDEFALLFRDLDEKELVGIVKDVIKELEKPYNIKGNEIIIRFRAGVSFEKKEYLRADVALDMAKELKKDIVFGREVDNLNKYEEHLKWLKKIKWALENDKIVPFYQPIVDKDKNIIKYEALVRLIDEDGKVISPFFFLDVAKKSRFYLEITKRVINKAVEKIRSEKVSISVNLTLEDINDKEMREFILEKVDEINKNLLTFEIVESEDVRENNIVREFLKEIKNRGALIYIDDFGSGYSNFDYLIKLNPDGVKIDGSLIKDILINKNNEIIVKTIISFAKEMNIKTIAEYVENEEIFKKLIELGVDYFQGYYFSPPKPDIGE